MSWNALLIGAGLVLVAAVLFATRRGRAGDDGIAMTGNPGGDLSFALKDFADGEAHFYRYVTAVGKEIRFFIMRSSDGVTRAAFDACDVCYRERRGYRQLGHSMICNNCGEAFRSTELPQSPRVRSWPCSRSALRSLSAHQAARIQRGVPHG